MYQKIVGGGSASMAQLQGTDTDSEFYTWAEGNQENPGLSRAIQGAGR
jgi:hypothetical protein